MPELSRGNLQQSSVSNRVDAISEEPLAEKGSHPDLIGVSAVYGHTNGYHRAYALRASELKSIDLPQM